MTLSYLALALAIVLLLAGIAETAFTFRTIAQRHAERPTINRARVTLRSTELTSYEARYGKSER